MKESNSASRKMPPKSTVKVPSVQKSTVKVPPVPKGDPKPK